MSERERPAAQSTIPREAAKCLAIAFVQIQAAFHVGKLSHIVIPAAVDRLDRPPAKKDVWVTLDHSLTDHHAPPLLLDRYSAVEIAHQHGLACFLDLEKQRNIGSVLLKQHNPATGPDAAYTNNFARDIDDPVARQQAPAVLWQGCEIGSQHGLQGFCHRCAVREMLRANDQGHILYDPILTVDLFC